jgi:hypothetical protein
MNRLEVRLERLAASEPDTFNPYIALHHDGVAAHKRQNFGALAAGGSTTTTPRMLERPTAAKGCSMIQGFRFASALVKAYGMYTL